MADDNGNDKRWGESLNRWLGDVPSWGAKMTHPLWFYHPQGAAILWSSQPSPLWQDMQISRAGGVEWSGVQEGLQLRWQGQGTRKWGEWNNSSPRHNHTSKYQHDRENGTKCGAFDQWWALHNSDGLWQGNDINGLFSQFLLTRETKIFETEKVGRIFLNFARLRLFSITRQVHWCVWGSNTSTLQKFTLLAMGCVMLSLLLHEIWLSDILCWLNNSHWCLKSCMTYLHLLEWKKSAFWII